MAGAGPPAGEPGKFHPDAGMFGAAADAERYRRLRPGATATAGQILEVPLRFSARLVAACAALSIWMIWVDRKVFGTTPESLTPDFQERARRVGPVAERVAAPPVFLNPIRNG